MARGAKYKITPEQTSDAVARRLAGEPVWAIAEALGLSPATISRALKRAGLPTPPRRQKRGARCPSHFVGTPEHNSWHGMWQRCTDPSASNYPYYGGAGIEVCARWEVFENFLADMGPRPAGSSLDRIDPAGPYAPHNCRWADASTQSSNQRKRRRA